MEKPAHTFAYWKYPDAPWVMISPSMKVCPVCGTPLVVKGKTAGKVTVTMNGIVKERWKYLRCPNPKCSLYGHTFKPTRTLSFPKSHPGIDVIAFMVIRRYSSKDSAERISKLLKERGVNVSPTLVRRVLKRMSVLLSLKLIGKVLEKLRKQGFVVLSLDGVQPEKGKATLWIISDVVSGEKIHAEVLQSQSAESITEMLGHVKAKLGEDIAVKAVVSDGQKAIELAVKTVFPGAKHQFCQYHFLRDVSKQVTDADRSLTKKQRASVRRIYEYQEGKRNIQKKAS